MKIRSQILMSFLALGLFMATQLKAQTVEIGMNFTKGIDYLIEDCSGTNETLNITLVQISPDTLRFAVSISGSATNNVDYSLPIPSELIFPPGILELSYPIIPITDGIPEGTESIIIELSSAGSVVAQKEIELKDALDIRFIPDVAEVRLCANTPYRLFTDGPPNSQWIGSNLTVINANEASIDIPTNGEIMIIGSVEDCADTARIQIMVDTAFINIIQLGEDNTFCTGDTAFIEIDALDGFDSLVWNNPDQIVDLGNATFGILVNQDETIEVTAYYTNCSVTATYDVLFDAFYMPSRLIDDTVCQGYAYKLVTEVPENPTQYRWTPPTELSNANIASPYYYPGEDVSYTLHAQSIRGFCQDSLEIPIVTLPAYLNIIGADTVYYCLGDTAELEAESIEDTKNILWSSSNSTFLKEDTGSMVSTIVMGSTTIIAEQTFENGCVLYDTVFLWVDSLPEIELMRSPNPRENCIPTDNDYCVMDSVYLFSDSADLALYPSIMYEWTPNDQTIIDTNIYQDQAVSVDVTKWYKRTTTNNACVSEDSILVRVVPASIPLLVQPNSICYDGTYTITITPEGLEDLTEIEWSTEDDSHMQYLDCNNCNGRTEVSVTIPLGGPRNITLQVNGTKEACCPAQGTARLNVTVPTIPITFSQTCPDDPVQLDTEGDFTDLQWGGTGVLSCTDCPTPTINVSEPFLNVNVSGYDNTGCYSEGFLNDQALGTYTLSLEASTDSAFFGETVVINANLVPLPNGTDYAWSLNGEAQTGNSPMFSFNMMQRGVNTVVLVATTPEGCVISQTILIEGVIMVTDVYFPNVFSPSINEMEFENNKSFRPYFNNSAGIDYAPLPVELIADFKVFSRFGKKVYDNETNELGWDGTFNDKEVPSDVYLYIIEIINADDGSTERYSGDVTLIR